MANWFLTQAVQFGEAQATLLLVNITAATSWTDSLIGTKRAMVFFQVVLFLCFTVDSIMLIKVQRKRKETARSTFCSVM
jgi:hypothetical protein